MNEGYLIVKCLRCGSVSQLAIKAVRSEVSICPVCQHGETECIAVQSIIQLFPKPDGAVTNIPAYSTSSLKFSNN